MYGNAAVGAGVAGSTIFEVPAGQKLADGLATVRWSSLVSSPGGGSTTPVTAEPQVADAAGNVYGTADLSGANGDGSVFELAAGSNQLQTIYSFDRTGVNGYASVNSLLCDKHGNLFGTAQSRTRPDAVIEITAKTHALNILTTFDSSSSGSHPGGLVMDRSGNIFGTTSAGAHSDGTVFEINPTTGALRTLVKFGGTSGSDPSALAMDTHGNLFGTTYIGGDLSSFTCWTATATCKPVLISRCNSRHGDGAHQSRPWRGLQRSRRFEGWSLSLHPPIQRAAHTQSSPPPPTGPKPYPDRLRSVNSAHEKTPGNPGVFDTPKGSRTPVFWLRTRHPGPLDDRGLAKQRTLPSQGMMINGGGGESRRPEMMSEE